MMTGRRIVLFTGQLIVFVMCILMIEYVCRVNIHPDKEVKKSYQQINSFLISKRLSVHQGFTRQYRADFLISYNVNGVQYNRWVSGNGLDMSFDRNRSSQEHTLSQFSIGGTYPSWYNPDNPQIAVLVLRHDWLASLSLILPALIGVLAVYTILNDLPLLIGIASAKIRR